MVTPEDLLPVALCTSCVYKLEMCHEFVHGCLDADIKLRTILGLQVDHKIYSDEDTTDTEPSAEKEREQDHYSNIYEDSADQAFENHTQVIINSEEADGKLDRTAYRKVPSVLARQNSEVHVKHLDEIKYEAHDFDHYSDGKLDHTEYTGIQTERTTEVRVKGVVDRKYEARNFDHYSSDKLDCAEYTDIQTEQNTEMDAENVNETECEADTENVHETECEADNFTQEYDLQNTEVQEGSYDIQIRGRLQRSEPSAASMELRSGRAVKKVTLKTKKPKFKVIVVKMKDAVNVTHTGKFKDTLDFMMSAKEVESASDKNLLAEIQLPTGELPYECTYCGKRYRLRRQLANHRLIHANSRLHKCPVCGKGFNRQQHLRAHIRTHQKSLKYTCKVCKSPFLSVGDLIIHRKTHTQEEIEEASKQQVLQGRDPLAFVCQICGKQLASKFTLKNHVMMHADDKPFICEICGKSFTMKSTLHTHHRVHTGERPHSCQHCGEAFLSRQNLIVHERIHTGETPFKCAQCDKAYRSRHSLRQHLLFHADYRPHECQECGKKFRRQDILVTHIRTHTGERPFACNVCGRAFKQRGDCNKHQQRHAL
jgi:KRAB domain-containing zinc finger protein